LNIFTYRPLTELEFLSKQTLINIEGGRTSNGVLASRIIPDGLTFVLIGAKVSASFLGTGESNFTVELRSNGTVLETAQLTTAGTAYSGIYEFISKGNNLIGDGVVLFDLNIAGLGSGDGEVSGIIFGYEKNT